MCLKGGLRRSTATKLHQRQRRKRRKGKQQNPNLIIGKGGKERAHKTVDERIKQSQSNEIFFNGIGELRGRKEKGKEEQQTIQTSPL